MTPHASPAERLDRAVEALLEGADVPRAAAQGHLDRAERDLIEVAGRMREALVLPPSSDRFDARLGARLGLEASEHDPIAWARRHPGRLLVGGALGSAVGVGVTAYAVWRSGRRAGAAHRLLHR